MTKQDNCIPEMVHPLGKYWSQPELEEIEIDDTHALMGLSAFDRLHEYSTSIPSGVYTGKMWKRRNQADEWYLVWFGRNVNDKKVSVNYRKILYI